MEIKEEALWMGGEVEEEAALLPPNFCSILPSYHWFVLCDERFTPGRESALPCITALLTRLEQESLGCVAHFVRAGESLKSFSSMLHALTALESFLSSPKAQGHVPRSLALMSIGGGSVSDVGGLMAHLLYRGVMHLIVPTTIIAMIDAGLGGKCALSSLGSLEAERPLVQGVSKAVIKNFYGAVHRPCALIYFSQALTTLPLREWVSSLGELVKHALLESNARFAAFCCCLEEIFAPLFTAPFAPLQEEKRGARASEQLLEQLKRDFQRQFVHRFEELIVDSARCKQRFCSEEAQELREGGKAARDLLNLGHTLGHAIEPIGFPHGFCILYGIALEELLLARYLKEKPSSWFSRYSRLLSLAAKALPLEEKRLFACLQDPSIQKELLSRLSFDKKNDREGICFMRRKKEGYLVQQTKNEKPREIFFLSIPLDEVKRLLPYAATSLRVELEKLQAKGESVATKLPLGDSSPPTPPLQLSPLQRPEPSEDIVSKGIVRKGQTGPSAGPYLSTKVRAHYLIPLATPCYELLLGGGALIRNHIRNDTRSYRTNPIQTEGEGSAGMGPRGTSPLFLEWRLDWFAKPLLESLLASSPKNVTSLKQAFALLQGEVQKRGLDRSTPRELQERTLVTWRIEGEREQDREEILGSRSSKTLEGLFSIERNGIDERALKSAFYAFLAREGWIFFDLEAGKDPFLSMAFLNEVSLDQESSRKRFFEQREPQVLLSVHESIDSREVERGCALLKKRWEQSQELLKDLISSRERLIQSEDLKSAVSSVPLLKICITWPQERSLSVLEEIWQNFFTKIPSRWRPFIAPIFNTPLLQDLRSDLAALIAKEGFASLHFLEPTTRVLERAGGVKGTGVEREEKSMKTSSFYQQSLARFLTQRSSHRRLKRAKQSQYFAPLYALLARDVQKSPSFWSHSALLQEEIAASKYIALPAPQECAQRLLEELIALRAPGEERAQEPLGAWLQSMAGLSISAPYKELAYNTLLCSAKVALEPKDPIHNVCAGRVWITPLCQSVRACNTLTKVWYYKDPGKNNFEKKEVGRREGEECFWIADNTDVRALKRALRRLGIISRTTPILILGTGSCAKAFVLALRCWGFERVALCGRKKSSELWRGSWSQEQTLIQEGKIGYFCWNDPQTPCAIEQFLCLARSRDLRYVERGSEGGSKRGAGRQETAALVIQASALVEGTVELDATGRSRLQSTWKKQDQPHYPFDLPFLSKRGVKWLELTNTSVPLQSASNLIEEVLRLDHLERANLSSVKGASKSAEAKSFVSAQEFFALQGGLQIAQWSAAANREWDLKEYFKGKELLDEQQVAKQFEEVFLQSEEGQDAFDQKILRQWESCACGKYLR